MVAKIPGTERCLGIKFIVRTGDVWSMEDDGRYEFMHAVAAPYPSGVHKTHCMDCKVTATLRVGIAKNKCYEESIKK